jgi:hypothetical protein
MFKEYIRATPRPAQRKSPSSNNMVNTLNITTRAHPEFTRLIPHFGGAGKDKTVPKVLFLKVQPRLGRISLLGYAGRVS